MRSLAVRPPGIEYQKSGCMRKQDGQGEHVAHFADGTSMEIRKRRTNSSSTCGASIERILRSSRSSKRFADGPAQTQRDDRAKQADQQKRIKDGVGGWFCK